MNLLRNLYESKPLHPLPPHLPPHGIPCRLRHFGSLGKYFLHEFQSQLSLVKAASCARTAPGYANRKSSCAMSSPQFRQRPLRSHPLEFNLGCVTTQIHTANTERAPLAGLSVCISHKAHKKKEDAVETFRKDIATALDALLLGCAPCWGRGDTNWNLHTTANCKQGIATEDDKFWGSWHMGALRRLEGYCWGCCRLQGKDSGHPYIIDLRDCPWKHLIKAAIYAWVVQPLNADVLVANFVPPEVLASNDFETFWTWMLQPEPAGERGITNFLLLFHSLALALKLIGTP
ncbi:hypothetical protein FB451DRAFT_1393103 [Mycena latifolia]|nr:hypothetical protein FB451DRAFT_1393103 [Mycena latifolia]